MQRAAIDELIYEEPLGLKAKSTEIMLGFVG